MHTSYTNGILSTEPNKPNTRSCQSARVKVSNEPRKNSQNSKVNHGNKAVKDRVVGRVDQTPRGPANLKPNRSMTTSTNVDNADNLGRTATTTTAATGGERIENNNNNNRESSSGSMVAAPDPQAAEVGSTSAYEPVSAPTPYAAHTQVVAPGVQCNVPNCNLCYPVADSVSYGPPFVSGAAYPGVSPSPGSLNQSAGQPMGYVWVGQDPETQRNFYQAQMALSALSLNTPNTSACLVPECAMGVPLIQTSMVGHPSYTNVPSDVSSSTTPFGLSSSNVSSLSSQLTSTDNGLGASGGNGAGVDSTGNQLIMKPSTNGMYSDSTRTGQPFAYAVSCAADSDSRSGLSITTDLPVALNAPTMNTTAAMWPGANYFGSNTYWIPTQYSPYAQPYYQTVPVPMAEVSPTPGLAYMGPSHMTGGITDHPSVRVAATTLKDKRSSAIPEYYLQPPPPPNSSMSPYPHPPNTLRFTGPTTQSPVPEYNQPTGYAANPMPPSAPSLSWTSNPAQWQLLLSALAASRNASGGAVPPANPPFTYTGLSVDRASVMRRRAPFGLSTGSRTAVTKGFDPVELSQLKSPVNPIEFDESLLLHTRYFVIRSDSEYNVHQSIRHGVWCSTRSGNQCLDEAYQSVQVKSDGQLPDGTTRSDHGTAATQLGSTTAGHIILFFSVRASGHLNGVAEMIGPVNPQKRCSIWQDARFRGEIPVRWIYVKNVPNSLINHISFELYENRPITGLRDTTEIQPASKAEELLRIIHNYGLAPSVQA